MAKNTVQDTFTSPHKVIISERKQMEITGVVDISAFDESQVYLKTSCGHVRISGKNLHVTSLLPNENKAMIEGTIDSLYYSSRKNRGILSRLTQ